MTTYFGYYVSQPAWSPFPLGASATMSSLADAFQPHFRLNPTAAEFVPKTYFSIDQIFDGEWCRIPRYHGFAALVMAVLYHHEQHRVFDEDSLHEMSVVAEFLAGVLPYQSLPRYFRSVMKQTFQRIKAYEESKRSAMVLNEHDLRIYGMLEIHPLIVNAFEGAESHEVPEVCNEGIAHEDQCSGCGITHQIQGQGGVAREMFKQGNEDPAHGQQEHRAAPQVNQKDADIKKHRRNRHTKRIYGGYGPFAGSGSSSADQGDQNAHAGWR